MTTTRLGVVVIGQSPRPTLEAELKAVLSPDVAITLRGALDGMSRDEIGTIPPKDGADALFTILPSGESVSISKTVVEERAIAMINGMGAEGFATTLFCCTGTFPHLAALEGKAVLPSLVLHNMVEAVLAKGTLGVFSPLPEQTALIADKWKRDGIEVKGVTLRPGSDEAAVDFSCAAMAALKPDLVVMDCMSYSSADKARLRKVYHGPAILSIAAMARVLEELVS
jgi:protein AroM